MHKPGHPHKAPNPVPATGKQPTFRKSPPFLAPAREGRRTSSMAIRYGRLLHGTPR
ncbi:MAG: hypothetical protein OEW35_04610 [Gammaproteobacteria bacterium]|nr:hypothetical protein [Gammaproteobacteria bacterium]MDH4254476.1 hypothetical protein [Gammaproteobacteria bacterium]MDH5309080.1 hypothetical protein [Gammaproteobacteria bacterium]